MNKVYLLLRNNQKSGPHSLEELAQLGLKPKDLIWVEGKSLTWSYPNEISALKNIPGIMPDQASSNSTHSEKPAGTGSHSQYLPREIELPAPDATGSQPRKKVFVSMPVNKIAAKAAEPVKDVVPDLEKKAEEIRRRTQSYVPPVKPVGEKELADVRYERPVNELEEDYSSWMYKQKSKKKNNSWVGIAGAMGAVLLLGAAFGISRYDFSDKETEADPATVVQSGNSSLITPSLEPAPTSPVESAPVEIAPGAEPPRKENQATFASNPAPVNNTRKAETAKTKLGLPKEPKVTAKPAEAPPEKAVILQENKTVAVYKKPAETPQAGSSAPEKKKTVGSAISGFFNKFKKKVDVLQEEGGETEKAGNKPSSPVQEAGTERKTRRRTDEPMPENAEKKPAAAQIGNLEELVELSSNEPAEKWMLGVHSIKLTMHNRSTEPMRSAVVEVRYFSEQNELLEKKVIQFNNVAPFKSATLPIPDHRLADHTAFKVLSATN